MLNNRSCFCSFLVLPEPGPQLASGLSKSADGSEKLNDATGLGLCLGAEAILVSGIPVNYFDALD